MRTSRRSRSLRVTATPSPTSEPPPLGEGIKGFWEQRLQYLLNEPDVRTYSVAIAYVRLGDRERALGWLEKLFAERGAWVRGLKVQPEWDSLRADPRFQDLLRQASIPLVSAPLTSNDASAR